MLKNQYQDFLPDFYMKVSNSPQRFKVSFRKLKGISIDDGQKNWENFFECFLSEFGFSARDFTFSYHTYKTCFSVIKEIEELTFPVFKDFVRFEYEDLKTSAAAYLSTAERSPRAFDQWIFKRQIPVTWQKNLIKLMKKHGFLSPERFSENYAKNALAKGRCPWAATRFRLFREGIDYKTAEGVKYNSLDALLNYIKRHSGIKKLYHLDRKKAINRLKLKGYYAKDIDKAFSEVFTDKG